MQIKGMIMYVTGGASGLGEATVRKLVQLGARVAVLDVNEELGHKLELLLKDVVHFVKCDITSEQEVLAAIKSTDAKWPGRKTAGVVNAAGIGMAGVTVLKDGTPFDLEAFKYTIDINLTGTFNVSRLIASRIVQSYPAHSPPKEEQPNGVATEALNSRPGALEEERGVIILTSSVSYQDGQLGQTAYAASKGGVAALALPMARDLARYGIRVVAIAPSLFVTAMSDKTGKRAREAIVRATEFPPRLGHADEFAHLVGAIVENPMLNGSVIRIDGATRLGKL